MAHECRAVPLRRVVAASELSATRDRLFTAGGRSWCLLWCFVSCVLLSVFVFTMSYTEDLDEKLIDWKICFENLKSSLNFISTVNQISCYPDWSNILYLLLKISVAPSLLQ